MTDVYALLQFVTRRRAFSFTHGYSAYRVEWIARGTGTKLYSSKITDTKEQAITLALAWLAKHADQYRDTTPETLSIGDYRGPGRAS